MSILHLKTISLLAAIWLGLGSFAVIASTAAPLQLSGKNEVPPVITTATGKSIILVASDGSVSGHISTSGLTGTMAHVHMGAKGSNGPPIITLIKGEKGQWMVPAGAKLSAEQLKAFNAGGLYINVHSKVHADGAIRGQLSN